MVNWNCHQVGDEREDVRNMQPGSGKGQAPGACRPPGR